MNSPEFDILIRDRKGNVLAVVKTKSRKDSENEIKSASYKRLQDHPAIRLGAKFEVFVTIDKGNRPRAKFRKIKNGSELREVPHFSDIIRRYNDADIPTEAINHFYLQTLVWSWFLDIAKGRERDEKVTNFLKEIGFYEKAINGDAELELAA